MKFLYPLILLTIFQQITSWCLRATLSQTFEIREVDWAPDNSIFVTASKGQKVVRIYNAKNFELLYVHNNSGVQPKSVKISKDSKWIGIGYNNSQLQILSSTFPFSSYFLVATGQGTIAQVDFSYDYQKIMSCGNDQGYVTYNIATKTGPIENIKVVPNPGNAISCKYGPQGHIGYTDNNRRVRVHFPPGTEVVNNTQYTDDILEMDFKPASSDFGTVSKDDILRIPNSTVVFTDSNDLLTISIGKTGKYYAFGGKTKNLFIYNQSNDKIIAYFNNFNNTINSVRLSADQNFLVTGDVSGQVRVYASKCSFNCESGEYNASNVCKKCSQAITYCVNCKSGAVCDVCMAGFYVSGSSCVACYNSLNYCLECKDGSECLKCLDGYYLNAGKCVKCGMVGCLECNDSSTCTKCFRNDYYLNKTTNSCVQCANTLTNCIRCTDSVTCVDCQLGFYEDATTKKCVQCPGNCLICQANNNCTECKVGYWASGGNCVRCTDSNCISCNQTGLCYDCKQGTFLTSSNTCSKCTNPCSTCSGAATNCTGCLVGFYLDATNFQCKNCIQNCKVCNQSTKCLSCFPGFKLDATTSTCKPCSVTYNNCSQCSQSQCLKCRQAFYLDTSAGNTCKTCISVIPNCIQCANSSTCLQCVTSYFPTGSTGVSSCGACPGGCSQCVSGNNCTKCFSTFFLNSSLLCSPCQSNCFECTSGSSCRSCVVGYYLDGTVCKACSSVLSYCSLCVDVNTCNSCQPGAYLDTSSKKCNLCVDNCLTCNETDCFSCKVGYYIDSRVSPIRCKRCSDQCQECRSDLICQSCIDGYYLDSVDNKCKSCGLLFSHCRLCNKTNCLECEKGSALNISTGNTCSVCTNFIGNCKTCYWDNSLATSVMKCQLCNYGFGLMNTNLSCLECNTIYGCIECVSSSKCTKCEIGFYLKGDNTCGLCKQKCLTCENGLSCLSCQQGYVNDTTDCMLCQTKINGCSKCIINTATTYNCTYCQVGYYLDTSDKQCYLCHQQINGCYTCKDSTTCTACLDKYYLDSVSGKCLKCVTNIPGCQLCNSSSVCIACQDSYYLDSSNHKCFYCSDNIPGCLHCLTNTQCSQCQAAYYLHTDNTCKLCQSTLQGCIYCNSPSFCIQCRAGFYLDTTDNKCHQCTQPGCDVCLQTNPNSCVSCSNEFYLSGTSCSDCVNLVPYCYQCNNTQCLQCQVGYYLSSPLICSQCSSSISGCSRCNDGSTCLQCMSSYFVNSSNLCQQCNQVIFGCQNCINSSLCISCAANFFLNSTTDKCQSCTDLTGCMLCKNQSKCVLCQQKYYMDGSQCKLCSAQIKGCFSCVSNTVCVQCQSGYVLDTESYQCVVNSIEAKQKVQGLKLVSYYISSGMLKHILFAKGISFKQTDSLNITDGGKTKLLVQDYTGKQVQLTILSYQFAKNKYSIIFYTDNPLGSQIKLNSRKMSFRRLLSQQQINLQVLLKMDQNIYQQILPDLDYSGSMTVGYSLNSPQFTKSYMQVQAGKQFIVYEIIGIVCIVLFLINYVIKFLWTLPHSRNRHTFLPHIIALKACCLIVYPSHFEYMSFCKGFMVVDLHWLNSVIGQELTDLSDKVAVPFGLFFDNMSIAGTYLLGLSVYILLLCILQCWFYLVNQQKKQQKSSQQSQLSSQQERRRQKQFKIQKIQSIIGVNYDNDQSQSNKYVLKRRNIMELLWNIFTFSVVYYSCLSVQGAFYNYQQIITTNGVFYILGMLQFIYITIETFYSFVRNYKLVNKLRIYLKACLLSLAYLNPIYVTSVCVALDIMLILIHFYLINNKNQLSKYLTITHVLSTLSILFMIFISHSLISLFLTALSLLTSLALEIYIHYKEYQIAHQNLGNNSFSHQQNQQHLPNQPQQLNKTSNLWDLSHQNHKFYSPKNKNKSPNHKDQYASMETINQPDNQPNPFQIEEIQLPRHKNKFQPIQQVPRPSTTKQGGRRNKLRKTQQAFKSNVIQILPSRNEQNSKTIFDFDEPEQQKSS